MDQIALFILFVAMSGVIAYFGDHVGSRLGKKRLSIGGLRPRHTARLATVLVGVLISILTIAGLMTVSSGVREYLLRGPQLARNFREATRQLEETTSQANDAAEKNKKLTTQNLRVTRELAARKAELLKAQGRLSELQSKISALSNLTRTLTSRVSAGNAKIQKLNNNEQRLLAMQKQGLVDLKRVQVLQTQAEASLDLVKRDSNSVSQKNLTLQNSNDELQKEQKRLLAEQNRINDELKKIQIETKDASVARDIALSEYATSQSNLAQAKAQLETAKSDLTATEKQLNEATAQSMKVLQITNQERHQPITYKIGEEVARLSIRPGLSASSARGELTSLLRKARIEAQKRGAHATSGFPVAGIFAHTDPTTGESITTAAIERQIESQITASHDDRLIIATSSLNAFRGEPVSLEITVMSNPLVYLSGQIIAETVIDANRGDTVISDQFTRFLQVQVRDRAQKDGMIPVANSDEPFGHLNFTEIFQAIEQLKRADRKVRLQAISTSTVRAADPLKLEFRLR